MNGGETINLDFLGTGGRGAYVEYIWVSPRERPYSDPSETGTVAGFGIYIGDHKYRLLVLDKSQRIDLTQPGFADFEGIDYSKIGVKDNAYGRSTSLPLQEMSRMQIWLEVFTVQMD